MDTLFEIKTSLGEILDVEAGEITPETYVVRDLGAESIDLLELSVALNSRFRLEVNEDEVFLRTLRVFLNEAKENEQDPLDYLQRKYPFLGEGRVGEILVDMEGGPVLKVKDLMAYVSWRLGDN
ncbi:MAG TPA: phosphopantetheine-binding protein [Syntrophobacteria bacterium]|nr:phosphopantetheine-binding protein [Syntrophobacteria bacterium]